MNQPLTQQRIRITFAKQGSLRYVGHLDLAKTWERVLRRARVPLEYSQGFNPRPRMQFAAALPVGVSSDSELLDVWLTAPLDGDFPMQWITALNDASPAGLRTLALEDVAIRDDALPTQVDYSDYEITFPEDALDGVDLRARAGSLLALEEVIRQGHKNPYDLRPRILGLTVDGDGVLHARLSSNERSNARPDEVLDAMGLDATQAHIQRRRLHLRPRDSQHKGGAS